MDLDLRQITEQYQSQMDAMFKAHEQQIAKAQERFQDAVRDAGKHLDSIIDRHIGDAKEPPAKKTLPQAVWTKAPDGEAMLILNREAAIMQLALMDQLADVLNELKKLAPRT